MIRAQWQGFISCILSCGPKVFCQLSTTPPPPSPTPPQKNKLQSGLPVSVNLGAGLRCRPPSLRLCTLEHKWMHFILLGSLKFCVPGRQGNQKQQPWCQNFRPEICELDNPSSIWLPSYQYWVKAVYYTVYWSLGLFIVLQKSCQQHCATSTCTYVVLVISHANYSVIRCMWVFADSANDNNGLDWNSIVTQIGTPNVNFQE